MPLLLGSALAASLHIDRLTSQPHLHQAVLDLDTDLGYPIGERLLRVTFGCAKPGLTVLPNGPDDQPDDPAESIQPDPAVTKALLASRVFSSTTGAITVKDREGGTLILTCMQGAVRQDFSKINRVEEAFKFSYVPDLVTSAVFQSAVLSQPTRDDPTEVSYTTANVYALYSRGSWTLDPGFGLDGFAEWPTGEVLVSDGKALYPVYYRGAIHDHAALNGLRVGFKVEVYANPDTRNPNGWTKTVFDLKARTVITLPAAKPNLPIKP